ncbi:MAG TPA: hypothetical protein VEY67_09930, partial [Candidatus Dormibacteraeota bacterium]|nr:hypothetical protein [Candidatus Dormibacteraeota bacterium]
MSDRVPLPPGSVRPSVAGLLAGGVALMALLLGSVITGSNGFLEVVANGVTAFIPLPVFDAILGVLGPFAKGVLFAGVAVAVPLAGAALASVLARLGRSSERAVEDGVAAGALALAIAELVVLPLAGAGFLGATYVGDPLALHVPLVMAAVLYGAALAVAARPSGASSVAAGPVPGAGPSSEPAGLPRRTFLGRGLATLGAASLLGSGFLVATRVVSAGTTPLGRTPTSG